MVQIAHGWEFDVERGPDWLFVRPQRLSADGDAAGDLAEEVWTLLAQSFDHRLVLELDQLRQLDSRLIDQVVRLYQRVRDDGGLMRLAGLSAANQRLLEQRLPDACSASGRLTCYATRAEAVMGGPHVRPR